MPCTAKKFEAQRPELGVDGDPDVDNVLTTQELAHMIQSAGLIFNTLQPESFDMPFGFYTGAGVIFGNSGGVMEAVLRYAAEKLKGKQARPVDFQEVRGESGLREATITVDGTELKLAVVHGLRNARVVAEQVRAGKSHYDLIEVMACPGGCVGGAGQPVTHAPQCARAEDQGALSKPTRCCSCISRRTTCRHRMLREVPGRYRRRKSASPSAHHLPKPPPHHGRGSAADAGARKQKDKVSVCLGTNCYLKGSQEVLNARCCTTRNRRAGEPASMCGRFLHGGMRARPQL
jgi:NADH-quinone oxidoreductase subunit G